MRPATRTRRLILAILGLSALVFALVPLLLPRAASSSESRAAAAGTAFEQDGFRVEMTARNLNGSVGPPRGWDPLELSFAVREAHGARRALSGLTPLAWLVRRAEDEGLPDREQCKREIRALLAGRLAKAAAVSLNEYYAVTLDENNSLSIIDPQIDSDKTKTIGMVQLSGRGADLVDAGDRRHVLVTLPRNGRLAQADVDRRLARYLDLGGQPLELALQPDGRRAWVGQEVEGHVDVVDVEAFEPVGRLDVGEGPHAFAFRADSSRAFVASLSSGRVDVVETERPEGLGRVELGAPLVALAYSELSQRLYVALAGGRLAVIDPDGPRLEETLELAGDLSDVIASKDGRHVLALSRSEGRLWAVDTSNGRAGEPVETSAEPLGFQRTEDFVYVHHASSSDVLLVDLNVLSQEGRVVVTRVPMGQQPPLATLGSTRAPLLAPLPEGGGALFLNPGDSSLYHFMEGMNAPAGSYRSYPWTARGVLIIDRTLREGEDGVYGAAFRSPEPGTYTVPFVLTASPQLFGCFDLELDGLPAAPDPWHGLGIELVDAQPVAGAGPQPIRLRLKRADGAPVEGLEDLAVLVMRAPLWQWNGVARPLGDGLYECSPSFQETGRHKVLLASHTLGLELGDLPSAALQVSAGLTAPDDDSRP